MTIAARKREELADFLRTRRAKLSPAEVGLPTGIRYRRTPGLRREEVAQLAGVGLSWYTWLEQGRDIHVSSQVLESIARALQLSTAEKAHLYTLAGQPLAPATPEFSETVSPSLQDFIAKQATSPAFVIGQRWDVLAANWAATLLYPDFKFGDAASRNIVRYTFTSPAIRTHLVDWEGHARRLLAQFRASSSRFSGEAWLDELVAELSEKSSEFRAWWSRHEVLASFDGLKELDHPELGRLAFGYLVFEVYESAGLRVMVYTPAAGTATEAKVCALLEKAEEGVLLG